MSPGLAVLLIAVTYAAEVLVRLYHLRPHARSVFS